MGKFIVVDCEGGPNGGECAGPGKLGTFGAVLFDKPPFETHFYSALPTPTDETMVNFHNWLVDVCEGERPIFVSDNPAFDWQHINWAFHTFLGFNPFGHSARRIGDFWAGKRGNWKDTQGWKKYRKTVHDHNPVNDARGNAEAMWYLIRGENL